MKRISGKSAPHYELLARTMTREQIHMHNHLILRSGY